MRRRRSPQTLGVALGEIQGRLAPPDLLADVQRHWSAAAGEQVAQESWPESERGGVVTVRCHAAVWAAELTMLADQLLAGLNERLPRDRRVRALKFTAGPRNGPRR